jgi:hypothetical protein
MAVPERAVDEDGDLPPRPREIGTPGEATVVEAVAA